MNYSTVYKIKLSLNMIEKNDVTLIEEKCQNKENTSF